MSNLNAGEWQKISPLLDEALALAPEEREEWLRSLGASSPDLAVSVGELLAERDALAQENFLEHTPVSFENASASGPLEQRAAALRPGTRIETYEVISLLGAGGMGEVYRARDVALKRIVAIKLLPPYVAADPDRLRRFEQEAQAAAALSHPNILAIYRFGSFEGAPFIVSECLEGNTLRDLLRRGVVNERKAIDYAIQIANGLAAAHARGIVHRDLKPENLFVTTAGDVKILDFGLAKLRQGDRDGEPERGDTEPGRIMGTATYMSPEQVRGGAADSRSDIFAFGAILFEMLSGKRAFIRPTPAESMNAILNEDPPNISEISPAISPGLKRVVNRCLEKQPEHRFQSASDLAFALATLSEAGLATTRPAAKASRQFQWIILGAGFAFVLLAGLAVHFLGNRHASLPFEHFSIEQAMASNRVLMAAISPDGIYMAAVALDENRSQNLVLHHIQSNSERTIVQNSAYKYLAVRFSPDGSYINFVISALGNIKDRSDLYRVAVLGGEPVRILENVGTEDGAMAFSFVEGGRLCFARQLSADAYAFVGANPDGTDEKVLMTGGKALPHSGECGPDGKFALTDIVVKGLDEVDFANGATRTLKTTLPSDLGILSLTWSPNGDGLFVVGQGKTRPNQQIWFVSYPDGKAHAITNDLNDYLGISVSRNGSLLASVQANSHLKFEQLTLRGPRRWDSRETGSWWFVWLDGQRILQSDPANGLRVFNLGTNEATALPIDRSLFFIHPSFCGADSLVVSGGPVQDLTLAIYKIGLDGSKPVRMTTGRDDLFPKCTPDGRWLFYADNQDPTHPVLMRKPVSGGKAESISQASVFFELSQDGKYLAGSDNENDPIWVMSATSFAKIREFAGTNGRGDAMAFSSDSESLFYTTRAGNDTVIWRQPLKGGPALNMGVLPGKSALWLRPSPDGGKLGVISSTPTSQAVLIRDTY